MHRVALLILTLTATLVGCSNRYEHELRRELAMLREQLEALRATWQHEMSTLSNRLAALETRQLSMPAPKADAVIDDDMLVTAMTTLEDEVSRLARIVDRTGIEDIVTNQVDPRALQDVLREYTERRQLAQIQQQLQQRNATFHAEDRKVYGEELHQLYERARFRWGRGRGNREERERALQELLQKYPEAHATAMVVAEHALGALFRGSLEDAERYYAILQSNPKFAGIVTDWGIEAVPAIQTGLAHAYLQRNRQREAQQLLDSLEQNYRDSYILVPGGPRGGFAPRWERVGDVVSRLRERL